MVIEIAAKIPPTADPQITDLESDIHSDGIPGWIHQINTDTNEKLYISSSSNKAVSKYVSI